MEIIEVLFQAILGSRQIFQRMRNYAIYTCSITIRILLGFSVLIFAFKFDFPSFMVYNPSSSLIHVILIIYLDSYPCYSQRWYHSHHSKRSC